MDFGAVIPWRMRLLRVSHARFMAHAGPHLQHDFDAFCADQAYWLDDHALFAALKDAHDLKSWVEWPVSLARREDAALTEACVR